MILTKHGSQRAKERTGINKKGIERLTKNALERGMKVTEFQGSFRRYLDKVHLKYQYKSKKLIVYNNEIFIFCGDDVLITILDVPSKYYKTIQNVKNKK